MFQRDLLIEVVAMECPVRGEVHDVEKMRRTGYVLVEGQPVYFDKLYFRCARCDDPAKAEFIPGWLMIENVRRSNGVFSSENICEGCTLVVDADGEEVNTLCRYRVTEN